MALSTLVTTGAAAGVVDTVWEVLLQTFGSDVLDLVRDDGVAGSVGGTLAVFVGGLHNGEGWFDGESGGLVNRLSLFLEFEEV